MTTPDQERWQRVKERLRAEVGEDVFQSWFKSMELDGLDGVTARLSVPTRFLKSWIQSHYIDRVLACWQQETPEIQKVEVTVRSAVIRTMPPKVKTPDMPEAVRDGRLPRLDIGDLRGQIALVEVDDAARHVVQSDGELASPKAVPF